MKRTERYEDPQVALTAVLAGWQSDLWTALPAIVQSFNPAAMTCEVQPAIRIQFTSPVNGEKTWIQVPMLLDCPVVFPSGGGVTLTFPIQPGDEVLVVLASRCIDGWWDLGGIQNQPVLRMHDLSDGFVLPGIRSRPRTLAAVSTTTAQLRSDDGAAFVELDPVSKDVIVQTPSDLQATAATATITAPTINLNGNVNISGNLAVGGTLTNDGTNVGKAHAHNGVQPGVGVSGPPV